MLEFCSNFLLHVFQVWHEIDLSWDKDLVGCHALDHCIHGLGRLTSNLRQRSAQASFRYHETFVSKLPSLEPNIVFGFIVHYKTTMSTTTATRLTTLATVIITGSSWPGATSSRTRRSSLHTQFCFAPPAASRATSSWMFNPTEGAANTLHSF